MTDHSPTRRNLLSRLPALATVGAAVAVPATLPASCAPPAAPAFSAAPAFGLDGPDGKLIVSCYRLLDAQFEMTAWLTDEQGEDALKRWYAEIELLTELTPTMAEGRRFKAEAAYLAMDSLSDFELSREEKLALSALTDLRGRV